MFIFAVFEEDRDKFGKKRVTEEEKLLPPPPYQFPLPQEKFT
jgi:hypothetical protein